MWVKYSIIAVLIFASAPSCSKHTKPHAVTAPTEVANVRVSADGKVFFNQRVVTLDELRGEFQRLKQIHGGVWLSDESSSGASRQLRLVVKKAIVEAGLPMRFR
jgi:hypothetical protein